MPIPSWSYELAGILFALLLFARLVLWGSKLRQNRITKKRFKHGAKAQAKAEQFLIKKGYDILEQEHSLPAKIKVDGQDNDYNLRIDYLVTKFGRIYGVEVKTGEKAIDPLYKATRRQLLEYSWFGDFDGLFLLDMDAKQLSKIHFPHRKRASWLWIFALGFVLGAASLLLITTT